MTGWRNSVARSITRYFFISLAVSVYPDASSAIEKKISGKGKDTAVVVPGDDLELCTELQKGQLIDYGFTASRPLIFNLHYHFKEQVYFPIRSSLVIRKQSSHQAEKSLEYCLMWTNYGKTSAKLDITYHINPVKE